MKRNKLYTLSAAALTAALMLTACGPKAAIVESGDWSETETETAAETTPEDAQAAFDAFTRQIFEEMVSSDTLTLHYMVADPEAYGIEPGEITIGGYPSEWSQEDYDDTQAEYETLKSINRDQLTERQQLDYDILTEAFENDLKYSTEELFYYQEPLSATSGDHTFLPVDFAEYTFYDKDDVEDYLKLLADVPNYFDDILAFEKAKAEAGLFMSDESVDEVIDSCETFIENPDDNALIEVFPDKLAELSDLLGEDSGLTEEEIDDYTDRNETAVKEQVIPAYEKLIEGMEALKGSGKNEGGIGEFDLGEDYYEGLIRTKAGVNMSAEELLDYLDDALDDDYGALFALLSRNPEIMDNFNEMPDIDLDEPEEMLEALLEAIKEEYPEPVTSEYTVKFVHPSLEESLNPAFYMIPPIDDPDHNVIYLNNAYLEDELEVFTTLAHEGFPGHLYQVTWQMNSDAAPITIQIAPLGYTEGWATYVETNAFGWCGLDEDLAQMLKINQRMTLYLYAYADISIHTQGWTEKELGKFLADFGIDDEDSVHEVYRMIVTDPAAYLPYTIGNLQFYQMRQKLEEVQGDDFDPVAFHRFILNIGDCPFDILWQHFYQTFDITPEVEEDEAA